MNDELLFTTTHEANEGNNATVQELAENVRAMRGVPVHIFITMNGGDPSRVIRKHAGYYDVYPRILNEYSPSTGYVCKTTEDKYVRRVSWEYPSTGGPIQMKRSNVQFVFPKGSYLCDTDAFPEYVNGLLCSTLLEKGECINFLHLFGFGLCDFRNKKAVTSLKDYIFMEKISGDINSLKKKVPEDDFIGIADNLFIQGLFAISMMNRKLGIQHNDLHTGNMFYEHVTEGRTIVFGDAIITEKTTHLEYSIDGRLITIPFIGYLAKIGDFGFSVKYSEPIVGSKDKTHRQTYISGGVPAWRDDSYDMMFFTRTMYNRSPRSPVINRALGRILGVEVSQDNDIMMSRVRNANMSEWYQERPRAGGKAPSYRPLLREHSLRPWDLLLDNDIVGGYVAHSPKRVVRAGTLDSYYEGYLASQFIPYEYNMEFTEEVSTRRIKDMKTSEKKYRVPKKYYTSVDMKERAECIENIHAFAEMSSYTTSSITEQEAFEKAVNIFDRYCEIASPESTSLASIGSFLVIVKEHNISVDLEDIDSHFGEDFENGDFEVAFQNVLDTLKYEVDPPCTGGYLKKIGFIIPDIGSSQDKISKMTKMCLKRGFSYSPSILAGALIYTFLDAQSAVDRSLSLLGYTFQNIEECYEDVLDVMRKMWKKMYTKRIGVIENRGYDTEEE